MKIFAIKKTVQLQPHRYLDRSLLQKQSELLNIAGSSFHEKSLEMIIPGGLSKWEKLYYASTGNYPQSVMDRWFEKGTGAIHVGDYEVKIGDHLTGDSDYKPHPVEISDIDVDTPVSDSTDNTNIIEKLFDLISKG